MIAKTSLLLISLAMAVDFLAEGGCLSVSLLQGSWVYRVLWLIFIFSLFAWFLVQKQSYFLAAFQPFMILLLTSLVVGYSTGDIQPILNQHTNIVNDKGPAIFAAISYLHFSTYLCYLVFPPFRAPDNFLLESLAHLKERELANDLSVSGLAICGSLGLICAFIYRQWVFGSSYSEVLSDGAGLLPGNAWQQLALIFGLFAFFSYPKVVGLVPLALISIWLVLNYARVDVMGSIGLILFYLYYRRASRERPSLGAIANLRNIKFLRATAMFGVGMCAAYFFFVVGNIREKDLRPDGDAFLLSLLNYSTAQDIIYSTAACFSYVDDKGFSPSILGSFVNVFPSFLFPVERPQLAPFIVADYIYTNNGLHLTGHFYLNLGSIGVLLGPFFILILVITPLCACKKALDKFGYNRFLFVLIGVFFISIPRISWYGFIYMYKPLFLILPAILLLLWVADSLLKGRRA